MCPKGAIGQDKNREGCSGKLRPQIALVKLHKSCGRSIQSALYNTSGYLWKALCLLASVNATIVTFRLLLRCNTD